MDNMDKKLPLAMQIRQIASAFQQSRILLSAFELDLFTIINDSEKTSQQIARAAETDPRATERVLNALCAFGLLQKKGNRFSNTPASLQCLVRGKEGYLGGLEHTLHLWETWNHLTDVIRTGRPARIDDIDDRDPEWLRAFIRAMHDRGKVQAPEIARTLTIEKNTRILDIGGGSGVFSFAFVDAAEDVSSVVFDLPSVVPITEEYIEKGRYRGKVSTLAGDYRCDDFGGGYDIIFLSAIVHINSYDENKELIQRCAQALSAGGRIVIQDWIMDEDRTAPLSGAVFAINMLVGTANGGTYTASEITQWMEAAGISRCEFKSTPFTTGLAIGHEPLA